MDFMYDLLVLMETKQLVCSSGDCLMTMLTVVQGKSWGESPGLGGPGLGGPGLGGPGMGGPGQTTPTSILQSNWNDPRKVA